MTTPISPGALRAANELLGTVITKRRIETVAKLIDESTGLPELLEAARAMIVMGNHIDLSQGLPLKKIFPKNYEALAAAISKSEGTI